MAGLGQDGIGVMPHHCPGACQLPFKANSDRRHRIPRQRHRVTNWPAYEAGLRARGSLTVWFTYEAGLRARGSLTVWFTAEAVEAWKAEPRTTRGGQPRYSTLAITTALTLRAVFHLALRQTEGLIGSILALLGLDLAVPDHTTLSRRAETLEVPRPRCGGEPVHLLVDSTGLKLCGHGEWLAEKHGTRRRRSWKKLHLATDADTGHIVASELTDKDADDGSQTGPLLDRMDGPVTSFTGDGAYDRDDVYAAVAARHPDAAVIVPPRSSAVPSDMAEAAPTQRDQHLRVIAERGHMGWQRASGYNWRALVESDVARWKRVIGDGLRSQTDGRQATEVAIAADVLNRMLELGRPEYVRIA
jgi:Transposase DDE domain